MLLIFAYLSIVAQSVSHSQPSRLDCTSKAEFTPSYATYEFSLITLPYSYDFLEPYTSSSTVYAHHDHHHQTYVDKLNTYLADNPSLQDKTLVELVSLANNDTTLQKHAGGNYNHNLLWYFFTNPECTTESPSGPLLDKIVAQWGSFDEFKDEYRQAQIDLFGSGFVWVAVTQSGDLKIISTEKANSPLMGLNGEEVAYTFLGNDVWEHAYYLTYMWDRTSYVDASFTAIDWEVVETFYELYANLLKPVPI